MNTAVDLRAKPILGTAAEVKSHIKLYCWEREKVCGQKGWYQLWLHHKQELRGENSISEEVYHTGKVAGVPVRDWRRAALIMTHKTYLSGFSFGCLSILGSEIQSLSGKRSMAPLADPVRAPSRRSVFIVRSTNYKTSLIIISKPLCTPQTRRERIRFLVYVTETERWLFGYL